MKIRNIMIENYGCIDKFEYTFHNKPLIIIGKNGSGKSLVISNIVDSLILYKKSKYYEEIPEVKGNNYFKIGKKQYIKASKTYSKCIIEFDNEDFYLDSMSLNSDISIFNERELKNYDKNKFAENGFSRTVTSKNVKLFDEDCYLYFPVDRYYIPSWQNDKNYTKIEDDFSSKNINKSNTNIIKNNVADNLKEWLYRVFSTRKLFTLNGSFYIENDFIQSAIINILKIIKGDNCNITLIDRRSNNIPISIEYGTTIDLNSLSSGEIMMFCIFVSIIKEYDINHDISNLSMIKGICVIDEIDMNLHIYQQRYVLPKLISLFPNMQFIITSHSPFFVKGMYDVFGDNVDFVTMPSANLINNLVDFSEFSEVVNLFNEEGGKLMIEIDTLKREIENLENKDKIILITEGETDAKYLEKAYSKLGLSHDKIVIIGNGSVNGTNGGDMSLKNFLESQKCLGNKAPKIIGMFDNDNDNIKKWIVNDLLEVIPHKIYAFCIPSPLDRIQEKKISIEHYFTNDELRTFDGKFRLYQAGEFNEQGIHKDLDKMCNYLVKNHKVEPNYVLSGSEDKKTVTFLGENVSLSKKEFCDNVITDKTGFDKFDFSKFKQIIDVIDSIISKFE